MKDALSSGASNNNNGSAAAVGGLMLDGGLMNVASGVGGIELYEMTDRNSHIMRSVSTGGGGVGGGGGGRGCSIGGDYGREIATNICRQYIRSSSRYLLLDHLPDIGNTNIRIT